MKKVFTCFMAMTWLWAARGQQAGGLQQNLEKPQNIQRTISLNKEGEASEKQIEQLLRPGPNQVFIKTKTKQHKQLGLETEVYLLYVKGIRVLGGELRIVKQNGKYKYAFQSTEAPNQEINVKPRLNALQALDAYLKADASKEYAWQDVKLERALKVYKGDQNASYYPRGELVFLPQSGKLAYLFEIYATNPYKKEQALVDAINGDIIERYDLNLGEHGANNPLSAPNRTLSKSVDINSLQLAEVWINLNGGDVNTFGAYDPALNKYFLNNVASNIHTQQIPAAKGGIPAANPTEFESANSFGGVTGIGDFRDLNDDSNYRLGTRVHYWANYAYDYYLGEFNRLGYDGNNSPLDAFVYPDYVGSFYNREQSLFFNYLKGDSEDEISSIPNTETIFHEYAHAFTVSESGLVGGATEPGMLNEALSDIWANTIYDDYFKNTLLPLCQDLNLCEPLVNDWRTHAGNNAFQDLFFNTHGYSVVRDAKNPHNYYYPAFYKGKYWGNDYILNKKTDPHFNATVVSHWHFLLAEGGLVSLETNPSITISNNGIGLEKAAKIIYLSTTNFLGQYTDFRGFALQTTLAAKILFGENSAEDIAVQDAWRSVGISELSHNGGMPCTPPNQDPGFYVKKFSLSNIQNSKPKLFNSAYGDYTFLYIQGKSGYAYNMDLTVGGDKIPKGLKWSIWIDQDNSNSFDLSEKIAEGWPGTNLSLTLPPLSKGDKSVLRIILSTNPNVAPCYDPAIDNTDKYMEDYGIVIKDYCPIQKSTLNDYLKENQQFTGLYFKNITLNDCGGTELFNISPSQQDNLIDQSQKALTGGNAYSLSFNFKATPGLDLNPEYGGVVNNFINDCASFSPFGFTLGIFDGEVSKKDDEGGKSDQLKATCTPPTEDQKLFMLCPKFFRRYVWIDFNRNGELELNEKFRTKFDPLTARYYVNFIVPAWATTLEGETIIRIYAYLGNGSFSDADPCGNGNNSLLSDKVYNDEAVISKNGIDIKINLNKAENLFYMQSPSGDFTEPSPTAAEAAYEPVSLTLYPNPANDWVELSVKGTSPDNFTLEVYNADGMRMLVQQPWNGRGLDVSTFPNGIYILSLKREREVYTQKLMIQR